MSKIGFPYESHHPQTPPIELHDNSTRTTTHQWSTAPPNGHSGARSFSTSTSSTTSSTSLKNPVDIPRKVSDALTAKGLTVDSTGIVRWAADSTAHPRHWPFERKIYDTAVIVLLEFVVTMISNTGSSIASLAAPELGIGREMSLFVFTTLYLLGQALGGLVFSPIAESFGGRTIYLTSTFGYAVFCVAIVTWPVLWVVVVGRFMTGLLSAIPAVVAAGSFENMWDIGTRTLVIHTWIAGAVLGLCCGPPVATFVATSRLGW